MLSLLLAIPITLARADQPQSAHLETAIYPNGILLGDIVLISPRVWNDGDKEIEVPLCHLRGGTMRVKLVDPEQHSTSIRFHTDTDLLPGGKRSIPPGESRIIGLEALPFPDLNKTTWRFWVPHHWPNAIHRIEIECAGIGGGAAIPIGRRPEKEMDALVKFYESGTVPADWDLDRPTLGVFGYVTFPASCSLPENLSALEKMLSEGTLRQSVHATVLTARVYDAPDLETKRQRTKELFAWIDSRPELQRDYFYICLTRWSLSTPIEEFWIDFSKTVVDRIPKEYITGEYRKNYLMDVELREGLLDRPENDAPKPPDPSATRQP